jgi:mycothione reductase
VTDFDVAIIGSGSGNTMITEDFADKRVALVEDGVFGGTCLNVGCIPTKMYVYAAEVAETVRDAARFGVDAHVDGVRWPDIRDRIFGRIDPISAGGRTYRAESDNVTLLEGTAVFDGPRQLLVDGSTALSADQVVVATGSRPEIPEVVASSGVDYHTSDTVMRIDELPRRRG